jgi:hypothetical protein
MAQAIPAIIAIGGSMISANQQGVAASIARGEGKLQAQQEELAATQRETDRKDRLAQALAAQNARAGAAGVRAFEGSPLTIMSEDIRREQVATERDTFQSNLASMTARARGDNTHRALKTQSMLTIAKGVGTALSG